MENKLLKMVLIGVALSFPQVALAEKPVKGNQRGEAVKSIGGDERQKFREEKREKWAGMSDEEKARFHEERKAKWNALSKEEKVKLLNERHETMKGRMDEKWKTMSDDEKISYAEERMKHKLERKKDGHGGAGKHGGYPHP